MYVFDSLHLCPYALAAHDTQRAEMGINDIPRLPLAVAEEAEIVTWIGRPAHLRFPRFRPNPPLANALAEGD